LLCEALGRDPSATSLVPSAQRLRAALHDDPRDVTKVDSVIRSAAKCSVFCRENGTFCRMPRSQRSRAAMERCACASDASRQVMRCDDFENSDIFLLQTRTNGLKESLKCLGCPPVLC